VALGRRNYLYLQAGVVKLPPGVLGILLPPVYHIGLLAILVGANLCFL
jgi:hypothetical protein